MINSYPSFPSTGPAQQQQQNNKASIKMHRGIKSPAKRPALLPSVKNTHTHKRIRGMWIPAVKTKCGVCTYCLDKPLWLDGRHDSHSHMWRSS